MEKNDIENKGNYELEEILISYVTSFKIEKKFIKNRKKILKKFPTLDLPSKEFEDISIKPPIYVYKNAKQNLENSVLLKTFLYHLFNSIQGIFFENAFLEITYIDNVKINRFSSTDISKGMDTKIQGELLLEGSLINVLLYTIDAVTVFLIFENKNAGIYDIKRLPHLQHPRHIYINYENDDKKDEIRQNSNALNEYTLMEFMFKLIYDRLGENKETMKKYLKDNYRGRTYTSISAKVCNENLDNMNKYIPMIVEGYTNFYVKDPEKYVEKHNQSLTNDTKIFLTDKVFIVFSICKIDNRKMRSDSKDFISFGSLIGLLVTYLNLYQHEHFEVISRIKYKNLSNREIFQRLDYILSSASILYDPNFIETPFLKRLIRYLMNEYNYYDFYESLTATMNNLFFSRTQKLLIYLTIAIILASFISILIILR